MPLRKLVAPIGGLNTRLSYQTTPPFYTHECLNVRPFDTVEDRERIGSRPGIQKSFPENIPGGAHHLFKVDVIPIRLAVGQTERFYFWDLEGWTGFTGNIVLQNGAMRVSGAAVLVRQLGTFDNVVKYRLTLEGLFSETGNIWNGTYELFFEVLALDRPEASSFVVRLYQRYMPNGTRTLSFFEYIQGQRRNETVFNLTDTIPDSSPVASLGLVVDVYPSVDEQETNVRAFVMGSGSPIESTRREVVLPLRLINGANVGFGVRPNDSDFLAVERFTVQHGALLAPYFNKPRPVVVAIDEEGGLWSDRETGILKKHGDVIPTSAAISAADFLGELFITSPDKAVVFDPNFNTIKEWSTVFMDPGDEEETSHGEFPRGNHLLARYLGRMVLAGKPPHIHWMSRAGEPRDFDYFSDAGTDPDPAKAVNGQFAEYGALSGSITALVSFSDDYLLFGQRSELYRLVGDPLAGGRIVNISNIVGILDRFAWCVTPESALIFMDSEGLFMLEPGGGGFPIPISQGLIPSELRGIDTLQNRVDLVYDPVGTGVHIFIMPRAGAGTRHWWFDWRTKGFWPISLASDYAPRAAIWYDGDGITDRGTIIASQDGWLRHFDEEASTDDENTFASYCDYGPVRLASANSRRGSLESVRMFKPSTSGEVELSARVGPTAEAAFRATPFHKQITDDRAMRFKRGGAAAYLQVRGSNGSSWQMENIEVEVKAAGPAKPL